jgi:hypothetical protein
MTCHLIRRKPRRFGHSHVARQRLAVLRIVIPLAPGGCVAIHQQAGPPPHVAIEKLHAQLRLATRPREEILPPAQESQIVPYIQLDAGQLMPMPHILGQAPFRGLRRHCPRRRQALYGAQEFAAQALRVCRIVERDVLHPYAVRPQSRREMPHCGQYQHDLLLMMFDVGAFVAHFRHQNDIVFRIEAVQARQRARKLVTQHNPQNPLQTLILAQPPKSFCKPGYPAASH